MVAQIQLIPGEGKRLRLDMSAAKAEAGAGWGAEAMDTFLDEWLAAYAKSVRRSKAPKNEISEYADAIYQLYPLKKAPIEAKKAITGALEVVVGPKWLGERVALYGRCVAAWPKSYRFKDGRDTVPHPSTWFNQGRYDEPEASWYGPNGAPVDYVRPIDRTFQEPQGWRDEFPDCVYETWAEVPQDSKAHIYAAMLVARKAAVPALPESVPGLNFPDRE